jgi:riboflavin synthase
MAKIGIVDTMFSRVDMGRIAVDEIKKGGEKLEFVRTTVPGIKDLAVECKKHLENGCSACVALGMVGGAAVDGVCAHEASLGLMAVRISTKKHIMEVFVHENETHGPKDFYAVCDSRTRKHVQNAINIVLHPEKLVADAGKGIRQGRENEGSIETSFDDALKIGVVVAAFNADMTMQMEKFATDEISKQGAFLGRVIRVSGAYDAPLAVKLLLSDKKINAVAVLGYVKKGQTQHDEVVGFTSADKFSELSLEFMKPVTLGVIGPGATDKDAKARLEDYSRRAIRAAVALSNEMKS